MDAVKILGSLLNNNALGSKTGGNILGSLLGGGEGKGGRSEGNDGDILSTLLGGKKAGGKGGLAALAAILAATAAAKGKSGGGRSGGGSDLLGSLLKEVAGGGKGGASSGGLGDLVGGLLGGGKGGASSGMGGLLGSLLGGASAGADENPGVASGDGPPPLDPAEAEEEAKILIEAMCLAARSDGRIDETERETIVGRLGDLDEDEAEFLREQLSAKTSLENFVKRVPEDMNEQVYAFALMAVKLDSRQEAEFFSGLAQSLGLSGDEANEIHARLGQPELFA